MISNSVAEYFHPENGSESVTGLQQNQKGQPCRLTLESALGQLPLTRSRRVKIASSRRLGGALQTGL